MSNKINSFKILIILLSVSICSPVVALARDSMYMNVSWFLNGDNKVVIPAGYSGTIVKLNSWWGNHGLSIDLDNTNVFEYSNNDSGWSDCTAPETCVDAGERNFVFTNGFSLQDFNLWYQYWCDPTHGEVLCWSGDCVTWPAWGAGGTFSIDSREFNCTDNIWQLNNSPILDSESQEIYCIQKNTCGDGIIDGNETCDDFNRIDGDGCSSECQNTDQTDQAQKYGLFVGVRQKTLLWKNEYRGDLSAQLARLSFLNLPNVAQAIYYGGDYAGDGLLKEKLADLLKNKIFSKMKKGDMLFLYIAGHGGSKFSGVETTKKEGDEYIVLGKDFKLTDNDLATMLSDKPEVSKWVFLDSCHSGGFWGNDNGDDSGDLEKVSNTLLLAMAEEDGFGLFYTGKGKLNGKEYYFNGEGFGAIVLHEILSQDENGKIRADDIVLDGDVSYSELTAWVKRKATIYDYEGKIVNKSEIDEFGEPIVFSIDMYNPVVYKSADFVSVPILAGSPIAHSGSYYPLFANNALIVFDASKSYDPNGSVVSYSWDWDNDGIYDEKTSSPTITHAVTLESGKTKTIKLLVEDNDGLTAVSIALVENIQAQFPWTMFLPAISVPRN